jgi:hypothetical protein
MNVLGELKGGDIFTVTVSSAAFSALEGFVV